MIVRFTQLLLPCKQPEIAANLLIALTIETICYMFISTVLSTKEGQMPKIVDVEKMKQRIMAEAVHVFVKRGYHRATFAEIAERCAIGRTTIYQYFKSKEEIFVYAVEHINEIFEAEYKSILDDRRLDVVEKIKGIFTKFMLRCHDRDSEIALLVELWLILKRDNYELPRGIKRSLDVRDIFHNLLEEGVQNNQIRPLQNMGGMAFTLETLMESLMIYQPFMEPGELKGHLQNLHLLIDGLKAY